MMWIIATNSLLGRYLYNERGLRVKAERFTPQSMVQVVRPNGGEGLYFGALELINWSSMGVSGYLKLELLVNDTVAGVIADNVPAAQTSYLWPVGKILTGWVNPGTNCKVRVSAVVPPSPPSTTYYFYDSSGRLLSEYDATGTCIKDYLYLGGKMIGEFQPLGSKYYYYTSDQINSTRLVTDALGTVVHSAQYDPYGGLYKTWVDTWHPKPGFSGKERESSSEMDYFGARYYGHKQYRFLSVDPIINKDEAITNPQLLNLYSYCRNNPITFLDPDGREDNNEENYLFQDDISKINKEIEEVNRLFALYNQHKETDEYLRNIDYSEINNWAIKNSITLSADVISVVTSFYAAVTGNEFVGVVSAAADIFNFKLNGNDLKALTPEVSQYSTWGFVNIINKSNGSIKGNAKITGLWAGFIGSVISLISDTNELFK